MSSAHLHLKISNLLLRLYRGRGGARARPSSLDPRACERECVLARKRARAGPCDLPLVVDRGERQRGVVRADEGDLHRSSSRRTVGISGAATTGSQQHAMGMR